MDLYDFKNNKKEKITADLVIQLLIYHIQQTSDNVLAVKFNLQSKYE